MARWLPSLNAMRAYEAAARHLSFTRAAEELHVSQGAVSHHVKTLEDQLETKLFDRRPGGLALSEAGAAYLPVLRDAFDRLAQGTADLRRRRASNILTVSISPNFAARWLVHRLGDFATAHPDIDLRISATMEHIDFAMGDLDVAVRHGDGHWPGLHVTPLISEEVFPVLSPALLERGGPLNEPDDLRHYTLLHDLSSRGWKEWLAMAGAKHVNAEKGPYINLTSVALDAAATGQGVALARRALATQDLLAGRLIRPFAQALTSDRGYFIVCPEATADKPKIARFREWLLDENARDLERLKALMD
jgi:LysR family transcriptional regulator, glycine cleavage system transcriptional activator